VKTDIITGISAGGCYH